MTPAAPVIADEPRWREDLPHASGAATALEANMTGLNPADLQHLAFSDFAGATIEQVADYLYATEPNFMAALEADVQMRGITQAVELLGAHLVVRGHHRAAAAWRAHVTVPSAPYGHSRTPGQTIEHYRWAALRRSFPGELEAWRRHNPNSWKTFAAVAS